jgi:arylsulfatase A-like enzyme
VTQAVYTIASIGSVLTGQYPERHQSVSFADKLRDDVVTFPALLAENGYRTAGFSGNAVASKTFGLDQGYDEFFQIWERDDYTGHGDSVLAAFNDWLGDVGEDRFFAYVHFREPHFPYNPPPPFDTRFGASDIFPDGMADWPVVEALNTQAAAGTAPSHEVLERVHALYDGNLAYVDDLIGQLMKGIDDDTVVIVTADHGEALFEHDYIGHNTQLYEESIRVPLMLELPGQQPRRVNEIVELIDLAPTILELAGVDVPSSMQGRSLLDPRSDRVAFSRTVWKRARYSARTDRYKLIWDSRTGVSELYDLETDPGEQSNIVAERAFVSGYLEQRLLGWLRDQEALRSGASSGSAEVSEEERRQLEALGYTDVPVR